MDKQELEREDWQQAEETCQTAIELARSVGSKLGKGAAAHTLVALLRQELQLASRLRSEISKIDTQRKPGLPSVAIGWPRNSANSPFSKIATASC